MTVGIGDAEIAGVRRRCADPTVADLRSAQRRSREMCSAAIDGLAASEAGAGHGANRRRIVSVAIIIEVMEIVHVHAVHVVEVRVVDVDVVEVARAVVIPRMERFTPA